MKSLFSALALGVALAAFTVPAARAQVLPETIVTVNVVGVAQGYRASKLIGEDVENSAGEKIGKVDDLLVGRNDRVLYAIISVGGFLGIGNRLVAVPFQALQPKPNDDDLILPNATKDELKRLPEFKYASR